MIELTVPKAPRWQASWLGRVLVTAACAAVLLSPGAACAWLAPGHMATGAIAYDSLERRDRQAVAAVVQIMMSHPDRARFDGELRDLTGAARDRKLFEFMARWPDDVRLTPFDHPSWHYSEKVVSAAGLVIRPAFGRAPAAFSHQLAVARNRGAAAADRAVALCWVLHIVGDMHQPLHAGMWMSRRFPFTDAGGVNAWIRTSPDMKPQTFHRFWDSAGALDPAEGHRRDPDTFAARLEAEHPDPLSPVPGDVHKAFVRWVDESRVLARDIAYEDGRVVFGTSEATATAPPAGYVDGVQAVAERRLADAGSHIAAVLVGLR
nr:S1/P1 nuclease [Caulobacter sp. S45]